MSKLRPQRGLAAAATGCSPSLGRLFVALGVVLGFAAGGCGDVDGGQAAYPGTTVYQSTDGVYEFNLLEPPWRETASQSETFFVVPPNIVTLLPTEDGSRFSLHIYRQSTDAASALEADASSRTVESSTAPVAVASGSGSTGVEMSWQETSTVYHRDAYITIATGSTFLMHFSGVAPMADDAMVSQMIASFRPAGTNPK